MDVKKEKIIHIVDSLSRGGTETLLVGVVEQLKEYDNIIITLNASIQFEEINAQIIDLKIKNNFHYLFSFFKILYLYYKYKPKAIHAHLYKSVIIARLAYFFYFFKTNFFFSLHMLYSVSPFSIDKLSIWIERFTYTKSQHIIGVSQNVIDDYKKFIHIKGKYSVLYNPIEDVYFKNLNQWSVKTHLKLIAVGNLKEQKNYQFLINSVALLKDVPFTLDIYGQGPLKNELQSLISNLNLEDKVKLKGICLHINELLQEYDIFCLTSHHEGFGIAILEAMASGVLTVVSDIPVLREVTNGTSFLVDLSSPHNFINIIETIFKTEPVIINNKIKSAQLRATEISKKSAYMQQLRKLYNE